MKEFVLDDNRERVIEMLKNEESIKYSSQAQEIYTEKYLNNANDINIDVEIQKHVLAHFGYTPSEQSLHEYWKIPSTYWNDAEVKNSIFYMRHNIFKYTTLKAGDEWINVNVHDFTTQKPLLLQPVSQRPLILLAGSIT